jgi:hypothetical protein
MFAKSIVVALSVSVTSAACSVLPRAESRHVRSAGADIRGGATVRARLARAILSGPAVVKHLETVGDGTVTLYLTDDPGIGDRACPRASAEDSAPIAVLKKQSQITDLLIPNGKRVCAAVDDAARMGVTFHARAIDREAGVELALAHAGGSR